jgi:endonuclease YncB( thermonuclease family)
MYSYNAKVVKITDGDSIRMDVDLGFGCHLLGNDGRGMDIRLFGIDCPETRGGTPAQKAHGLLAKTCVGEHLKVGETYEITTHERGKFGRYLATIRLSKRRTINDMLVDALLAVPYHGQNKKEIQAAHEKNRKELVKEGLL